MQQSFISQFLRSMIRGTLLVWVLWIFAPIKAQSEPIRRYPLHYLERILNQTTSLHLISQYELGEIDWSMRVLRGLGIGTHMILSPTGGWGQQDLYEVAVENTLQKFTRLSAEIIKLDHLQHCSQRELSRLFRSSRARWMSDGSVHLPATIRFEVYDQCALKSKKTNIKLDEAHQKSPSKKTANSINAQLLLDIEKSLNTGRRSIVYAELSKESKESQLTGDFSCLSMNPIINLGNKNFDQWRAVRWLIRPQTSSESIDQSSLSALKSMNQAVKESFKLGKLRCTVQSNTSIKSAHHQPILVSDQLSDTQLNQLNTLLKDAGGAELWIWVK